MVLEILKTDNSLVKLANPKGSKQSGSANRHLRVGTFVSSTEVSQSTKNLDIST